MLSPTPGDAEQPVSGAGDVLRVATVASSGVVLSGLAAAFFVGVARDTGQRLLSPLPAAPADLLLCLLAVVGALLTVWLGLGVVASALAVVPGAVGRMSRRVADRLAPTAVRRAIAFLLGSALVVSFAPGAASGSSLGPGHPGAPGAGTSLTLGLPVDAPLPDLRPASGVGGTDPSLRPSGTTGGATPRGSAPTASTPTASPTASTPTASPGGKTRSGSPGLGPLGPGQPRAPLAPAVVAAEAPAAVHAELPTQAPAEAPGALRSTAESVVVKPGDTLWDIAARHLGGRASTLDIATEWPRWYALNADVIGADSHLILPGQRLVAPSPLHTASANSTPTSQTSTPQTSTPGTPTTPTDGAPG